MPASTPARAIIACTVCDFDLYFADFFDHYLAKIRSLFGNRIIAGHHLATTDSGVSELIF